MSDDPRAGLEALLPQVIGLTKPYLERGLVALYVHGSYVTAEVDHWSDLDLCAVRAEEAREAGWEWAREIEGATAHRADPVAVPLEQLGADGDWRWAFARCVLLADSQLLLGVDVRDRVAPATPHLLRVTAANTGCLWLRRLFDIFRIYPLPERVDDLVAEPIFGYDYGNAAWQAVMATLQLLRALVETRTGEFSSGRRQLLAAVAAQLPELHPGALQALEVRQRHQRYEPVDEEAADIRELLGNIPALGQRLLDQLAELGLPDPTYDGVDGAHYEADGTVRSSVTDGWAAAGGAAGYRERFRAADAACGPLAGGPDAD